MARSPGVDTKAASDDVLLRQEIHTEWEEDYLSPTMDRFYDKAFAEMARRLEAPKGARMLDAGCGYCFHAVRLARLGFDITGIDFSQPALDHGEEYLAKTGMAGKIHLRQANLLDLPFEDGEWEYVHCWGVLMHIPDLERALSELARVTKSGGRLVIMENNVKSLHVAGWFPLLRTLKRFLGRTNPRSQMTPRGLEDWYDKPGGEMLVRMTNIEFLERFLGEHDMTLEHRFATQFTEIYTSIPLDPLKRAVQFGNELWLDHVGAPELAQGNVMIFRKH